MTGTSYKITKCAFQMDGGNSGRVAIAIFFGRKHDKEDERFVGRIDFYPADTTLPPDCLFTDLMTTDHSYIVLSMPMNRYGDVMRTLDSGTEHRIYIDAVPGPKAIITGRGYVQRDGSDQLQGLDGLIRLQRYQHTLACAG